MVALLIQKELKINLEGIKILTWQVMNEDLYQSTCKESQRCILINVFDLHKYSTESFYYHFDINLKFKCWFETYITQINNIILGIPHVQV